MKKIITSILLVATLCMSVFSFAGCSKNGSVADFVFPEGGFDTSKDVEITFYHTMGSNLRDVLDRYIIEFNKIYPNIKVNHEQVGGYDDVRDQIKTEITVGSQPNIAYVYPDHVALYNMAGAVQTLDSLIASDLTVTRQDGSTENFGLSSRLL